MKTESQRGHNLDLYGTKDYLNQLRASNSSARQAISSKRFSTSRDPYSSIQENNRYMQSKGPVIQEENTLEIDAESQLRDDLDDDDKPQIQREESIYAKEIEKNLEEMLEKD